MLQVVRIERVQRIIAIQGVSLVRILNLPSLDRSVGEILNIPSGIVGRENLSGESLVSCAPSRFSLEILPPSSAVGDIHESLPPSLSRSGEDLRILTRSPPSITLIVAAGITTTPWPSHWIWIPPHLRLVLRRVPNRHHSAVFQMKCVNKELLSSSRFRVVVTKPRPPTSLPSLPSLF